MDVSDFFRNLSTNLPGRMIGLMDELVGDMTGEMIDAAPTTKIRGAIQAKKTEVQGSTIVGKIGIDLEAAPEALAYEYGSGLHSAKRQKYPIVPRNKQYLAFFWEKANENIPRLPDGRVRLKKVMHPGVVAKPYIEPSFEKAKENTRAKIPQAVLDAIRLSVP